MCRKIDAREVMNMLTRQQAIVCTSNNNNNNNNRYILSSHHPCICIKLDFCFILDSNNDYECVQGDTSRGVSFFE